MIKRIVNRVLYILLLSTFNTLYKYVLINESLSLYNHNSNFMGSYLSSSSYQVSYLKIFMLSFIALLLIDFWRILLTFIINKKRFSFNSIFNYISKDYLVVFFVILGCIGLFINYYLGLIIVGIGFIISLVKIRKEETTSSFIVSIFFVVLTLISLYFISY